MPLMIRLPACCQAGIFVVGRCNDDSEIANKKGGICPPCLLSDVNAYGLS